jgi:DNA invertase Pin-like site-specific DNA recombinase
MEESPEGILNQNMVMAFKQYERENNARRVKERMRARLLD